MLAIFMITAYISHKKYASSTFAIYLRSSLLGIAIFSLGCTLAYYQDVKNSKTWYGNTLAEAEAIKLTVTGTPQPKERSNYIPVTVNAIKLKDGWRRAQGELKLYLYKTETALDIKPGDGIIINATSLVRIKNSGNPFAFNYADYAARQGLYYQAFCAVDDIQILKGQSETKPPILSALRSDLIKRIRHNIKDSTTAALVEATMLNERAMLDEQLWQAYATTGIVHIIAISGMHVTILFQILLFFLLWIKNKKLEWIKYFIAIPLVWFYILLTGFPASAVRAGAMFTLLAFGIKLNRETNSINILLASAFILLCYNPYWLYDTGFQLSFVAVLSILTFYPIISRKFYFKNKIARFLWNTFSVSLAAQILTFPLGIYYFHQFPLWVLIANIPATIFSTVMMVGSLLVLILSLFVDCIWLGNILSSITAIFHQFIKLLAQVTPAYFREIYTDAVTFWLLMIAATVVALALIRKKNLYIIIASIALLALLTEYILLQYKAKDDERLIVYNTSRHSTIDYFEQQVVIHYKIQNNSLDRKTYNYVLLPARLGYRAYQEKQGNTNSFTQWTINGMKAIFLQNDSVIDFNQNLKTDYLILSNNCDYNPRLWHDTFLPNKIILDGSFPRWKAIKWKEQLSQLNVPVHWVQEDGAWILE